MIYLKNKKGGFKEFSKLHENYCVKKEKKIIDMSMNYDNSEDNFKYEMENAKMNKITDYLFLGKFTHEFKKMIRFYFNYFF